MQRSRRRKRDLHHGDKQIYNPQGVVSITVWFWIRGEADGEEKRGERTPRWEEEEEGGGKKGGGKIDEEMLIRSNRDERNRNQFKGSLKKTQGKV